MKREREKVEYIKMDFEYTLYTLYIFERRGESKPKPNQTKPKKLRPSKSTTTTIFFFF